MDRFCIRQVHPKARIREASPATVLSFAREANMWRGVVFAMFCGSFILTRPSWFKKHVADNSRDGLMGWLPSGQRQGKS